MAAAVVAWQVPRLAERTAAAELLDTAALLVPVVQEELAADPAAVQAWVRGLGGEIRLTLVAGDGRVLADSDRDEEQLAAMENHAGRPEVAAALATGSGWAERTSETTGRAFVYGARRFTLPARPAGGPETYVLRVARPLTSLGPFFAGLAVQMALAAAAAAAVTLLLSWWLDRRLFRPLGRMLDGAGRLAAGDYRHRLEIPETAELATLATALNRLSGRVEDRIAAVGAERDHLHTILASMSEGVLVVDREGRAEFANPALRLLFDLEGDVEGRLPLELARLPELRQVVEQALSRGEAAVAQVEVFRPRRRAFALTARRLASEPGGAVVVLRDVSEAQRLTAMRRDFVANVSHELKTPLSAIRGYAETLADGALAEAETARRFVGRILEQCRRLQALLDDLLTLSRLESVEIPLERRPVDLAELAEREADLLAGAREERGVALTVDAGPGLPRIAGDEATLSRLLANLLENAIKYNRPGGEVAVRLARQGAEVCIEVADTGIGIPAEALPRIFERFYRVDKGRARDEGGTGLGLAIVKHAAQAHGGRVEVDSVHGEGTTFRVWLPV